MEEIKTVALAVIIAIVVGAAIFTSLDVFMALSERKNARGWKSKYFNIGYRPEYGTEFCRAHLVGAVERLGDKALYLVEIHPGDAAKAYAWTVPEAGIRGGLLLEKGRFYKYAFKEELYD